MKKSVLPLTAVILSLTAASALAANSSATFNAKIKIVAGCNISTSDINFPDTAVIAGTENASSAVTVRCTKTTPYALSLSNQTAIGSATTTYAGSMASGTTTDTVAYHIGFVGGSTGTGNGTDQSFTMKGTIDTQATPTPASYTDARTIYVVY